MKKMFCLITIFLIVLGPMSATAAINHNDVANGMYNICHNDKGLSGFMGQACCLRLQITCEDNCGDNFSCEMMCDRAGQACCDAMSLQSAGGRPSFPGTSGYARDGRNERRIISAVRRLLRKKPVVRDHR